MVTRTCAVTSLLALMLWGTLVRVAAEPPPIWTPAQLEELRSLSLLELEPLPSDPTNRVADDPAAAALGRRLFFDMRLSANGRVACSTCHQPDRGFQDGLPLAVGVGTTARRAMPIAGTARSPFLFWDGRKDSLWAQALGPLESAVEHGSTRSHYARVVASHYRDEYEAVFGPLSDLSAVETLWEAVTAIFVDIGKAIAAYERRIGFGAARFDQYVAAVTGGRPAAGMLSDDVVAGLRLFIGEAYCTQCHNGPLLTNYEFHNTGVPPRPGLPPDEGRLAGAIAVGRDEFNCRSRWSDAHQRCAELEFMATDDLTSLAEVLDHYDRAPAAVSGHTALHPLREERRQLEAFLRTLSGPILIDGLDVTQVPR